MAQAQKARTIVDEREEALQSLSTTIDIAHRFSLRQGLAVVAHMAMTSLAVSEEIERRARE